MIEDEFLPDLSIDHPVQSLHEVSWDITCKQTVRLADGRTISAIDMQYEYLDLSKKYVKEHDARASNAEVLQQWETILTGLEEDPLSLHRELDWVAKYRLMQGYRERDGLEWNDAKLHAIDLQYHDVRRDKGLYYKLVANGKMDRIATDQEIDHAIMNPPGDTRAYFRGNCIDRYPEAIVAASWDSLIFDIGAVRLQVTDPHAAGEEWGRVDRAVVQQAPWVALFNPTGVDLVSRRVKNYQHKPEFGLLIDQLWVR
jgi:proteasome accessory factor A